MRGSLPTDDRRCVRPGAAILTGTDLVGTVTDDVQRLMAYGLEPIDALRAASTAARALLGERSLEAGASADVVTFDDDPREDPAVLSRPAAVVLHGIRGR